MNILEQIVQYKKQEVARLKELVPIKKLETSLHFAAPTVSLRSYLIREDLSGIIAEIKRASPSKGVINKHINVEQLSIGYMQAGASALSVLTDSHFFSGNNEDLTTARSYNFCPILRKDFIVDGYQIYEAKAIGADAILLIASILTEGEIERFHSLARSLKLEILFEINNSDEFAKLRSEDGVLIGVNSRNLKDFSVNKDMLSQIVAKLPAHILKVAESGISSAADVLKLRDVGYQGFLIGELFMRGSNPAARCAELINEVKK